MKKVFKLCTLILFMFCLSGCFKEDKLTNNNVYTTIYPVQYLTNYLYGDTRTVSSIYPAGADVLNYKLTKKQKDTYEKGALFVYNGLTNEKELAREFLNTNKDMLLIDVSYGLSYEYSLEELWLSPNNYLMLAKNIKNNLMDYTASKLIQETLESKYKELEEMLSYMDAELRSIASLAVMDGNPVIIVSSNKLEFLKNYGFEVINLASENLAEATLKSNFRKGNYKDIYLCNTDKKSELIKELEDNYDANIIDVNVMYTLNDTDSKNGENYETITKKLIENIRSTTLS